VARQDSEPLADELAALLAELDTAIAARFAESRSQAVPRRRAEATPPRTGLRGVVAVARRWLGRGRPARERSPVQGPS
jgi:hypothetical protein